MRLPDEPGRPSLCRRDLQAPRGAWRRVRRVLRVPFHVWSESHVFGALPEPILPADCRLPCDLLPCAEVSERLSRGPDACWLCERLPLLHVRSDPLRGDISRPTHVLHRWKQVRGRWCLRHSRERLWCLLQPSASGHYTYIHGEDGTSSHHDLNQG